MRQKCYVVTVRGRVRVDTTVAVMAKSEAEAGRMALEGVDCDTEAWLRDPHLYEEPIVSDVSEWDELLGADQKHLIPAVGRPSA